MALLDTGFEGALAIPSAVLDLDLGSPDTSIDWQLADDTVVEAPVYSGSIEIVGFPPISEVSITVLGGEYLLGRGILDRFEVTFDHGRRVIVRP
jgi:predicted aspartyl protease